LNEYFNKYGIVDKARVVIVSVHTTTSKITCIPTGLADWKIKGVWVCDDA